MSCHIWHFICLHAGRVVSSQDMAIQFDSKWWRLHHVFSLNIRRSLLDSHVRARSAKMPHSGHPSMLKPSDVFLFLMYCTICNNLTMVLTLPFWVTSWHLDDTTLSSRETCCVFLLLLFCVRACGYCRCALGEILSICETPGWLRALENVTPAYIDVGVSSKWVEFQFRVNFKLQSVEKMSKCATIVNFFFMNFSKLNVRIILYTQHFNVFLISEVAFNIISCYYIFYTLNFYSQGLCLHFCW